MNYLLLSTVTDQAFTVVTVGVLFTIGMILIFAMTLGSHHFGAALMRAQCRRNAMALLQDDGPMQQIEMRMMRLSKQFPDGFTATIGGDIINPSNGYAVALHQPNGTAGYGGLANAIQLATEQDGGGLIGGWRDDDGIFEWDAVILVADRNRAIDMGIAENQQAIYDFANKECIYLNT